MKTNNTHPLILVFYLDRELMRQHELIGQFSESVNSLIEYKKMNAIAFFLPTDGEERVECINPIMVQEAEMDKINKMVSDIAEQFSVGKDFDDIHND